MESTPTGILQVTADIFISKELQFVQCVSYFLLGHSRFLSLEHAET